jgi:hypothetical protein
MRCMAAHHGADDEIDPPNAPPRPRGLATCLNVTPPAALGLLRQLIEVGIVSEATGRASWRAFVLA